MVTEREVYDYVFNSAIGVTVSQIANCFSITREESEKLLERLVDKRLLQTFNDGDGITYWLEKHPDQDALQNFPLNSGARGEEL